NITIHSLFSIKARIFVYRELITMIHRITSAMDVSNENKMQTLTRHKQKAWYTFNIEVYHAFIRSTNNPLDLQQYFFLHSHQGELQNAGELQIGRASCRDRE